MASEPILPPRPRPSGARTAVVVAVVTLLLAALDQSHLLERAREALCPPCVEVAP